MSVLLVQVQLTAKTALCTQTQARLDSEGKQHEEAVDQLQQHSQGVMRAHSEELARLQGLLAVANQHKCHTLQVRLPCLRHTVCITVKLLCAGVCEQHTSFDMIKRLSVLWGLSCFCLVKGCVALGKLRQL